MHTFHKNLTRPFAHIRQQFMQLGLALLLSLPAPLLAAPNLAPIVSLLLLSDRSHDVPMTWDGREIFIGEAPSVPASSNHLLSIDLSKLPADFTKNIQNISLASSGECYQIGGATLDPLIYEWNIISTAEGQCEITVEATALINTALQIQRSIVQIHISPELSAPANIYDLVAEADISSGNAEIEGGFILNNIRPLGVAPAASENNTAPEAAFIDDNTPTLYEFDASHNGVALKGVMMSSARKLDTRIFSGSLNVNAKTFVRFVQNTPVLIGSAVLSSHTGSNAAPDADTFAFLATAPDANLPGPTTGFEFNINGKSRLNVLCTQNKLVGFGKFEVKRTGTRISSSLVGFSQRSCPNHHFKGDSGIYSEFKVVNTHLGKILRGRGTVHPLDNGKITTSKDQNPSNPDFALYFLGIPERLSSLHKIHALNAGTQMSNKVRVLDPFALAKMAKVRGQNGRISFSSQPEALIGVQVGDILVGKPSARLRDGFIREVKNFGNQAGQFYVETEIAALNKVFTGGGFSLQRNLALGDVEQIIQPVYGAAPALAESMRAPNANEYLNALRDPNNNTPASEITLDVLPFPTLSLDHTFNSHFRSEGQFSLDASLDLEFVCRGALCTQPYFRLEFNFTEDFELAAIANTNITRIINGNHTLFVQKFATIMIGPVPLKPSVSLKVQMTGITDTDVEFGVDQHFSTGNGVELSNGNWSLIKTKQQSLEASPIPNYSSGTVNLEVRAALEGALKIAGLAGASIDVGIYSQMLAQTPRDPLWEITAGLNSEAEVELDLFFAKIKGGPFELFDIPFNNISGGTAPNNHPSIEKITVDGVKVINGNILNQNPIARLVSVSNPFIVKVTAFDAEDGNNCCTVHLTSSLDGELDVKTFNQTTANSEYRFKQESLSAGTHQMTISIWPKGENTHPSTAITETFSLDIGTDLGANCNELDLDVAGYPLNLASIEVGDQLTFSAEIKGSACIVLAGKPITFNFPLVSSIEHTDTHRIATDQYTFNSAGTFYINSHFINSAGDVIESGQALIIVNEPSPQLSPISGNFTYNLAGRAESLHSLNESTHQPEFAPASTPYEINLYNWQLEIEGIFRNPFTPRAGHTVSWQMTDPNAILQTNASGDVRITPSAATGEGWHRIVAIETNNTTGKQYKTFTTVYIHPNNTFGLYVQDEFKTDASHIPPLN